MHNVIVAFFAMRCKRLRIGKWRLWICLVNSMCFYNLFIDNTKNVI